MDIYRVAAQLAVVAIIASAAGSAVSAPGDALAPGATQPASRPADSGAKATSALKELAQALLDRSEVPISVPSGQAVKREVRTTLPDEGAMVIDERCRLGRDEESGMFSALFERPTTGRMEPPRLLLPCYLLEVMESAAKENPQTIFRVSGETTIYAGNAYMLLIKVTRETRPVRPPDPTSPAESVKEPAEQPAATAPAATDKEPAPPATQPAPSSDDVIRRLLADPPSRPVTPLVKPAPPATQSQLSVAADRSQPAPTGRGEMVIDRLVRITPEKDDPEPDNPKVIRWWVARFESDNNLQEPPIRLLPSAMLQRAQAIANAGKRGSVTFHVSGETTTYKGGRYLMLRKLVRERDMGRF